MDAIIRVTSRFLFPLIAVFGFYIALFGHLSPGGAFPAGVIVASGLALLLLAFERGSEEQKLLKKEVFSYKNGLEMVVMMFLVIFGYTAIRSYLLGTEKFFELWSGGYTILENSLAIFFIFSALFLIINTMVKE